MVARMSKHAEGARTERPILFSSPMVKALLDGSKTQTRRLIKAPGLSLDPLSHDYATNAEMFHDEAGALGVRFHGDRGLSRLVPCPYGDPGNALWVQEGCTLTGHDPAAMTCLHTADGATREIALTPDEWALYRARKFPTRRTPGRFMYRSCSRINLLVESVRVERLHAITEEDARAEGVTPLANVPGEQTITSGERFDAAPHRAAFACLWDGINGDRARWKSNPWVWVIMFKRIASPA